MDDVNEILDRLSIAAKAEFERKEIERQRLEAELRRLQIEQRRGAMVEDVWQSVPNIREEINGLNALLSRQSEFIGAIRQDLDALKSIIREWFEEFSETSARIEWGIFTLIGGRLKTNGEQLQNELQHQQHNASIRKQLATLAGNLDRLYEQRAKYGLNIPISLQNEIDDTTRAITALKAALDEYSD